jgi:murein DD-endopeptidase MepM/ murein hydrolase activator NlpD
MNIKKLPFNLSAILIGFIPLFFLVTSCNPSSKKKVIIAQKDTIPITNAEKRYGIEGGIYEVIESKIPKNMTFSVLMSNHNLSPLTIQAIVEASDSIFDFSSMRAGNPYSLFVKKDSTKHIDYLFYQIDEIDYIRFDLRDSVQVSKHSLPVRTDTIVVRGKIESSLWMSLSKNGVNPNLAVQLADIFAWTIDFYDLQVDDQFQFLYEQKFIDSTEIGSGKILACRFNHKSEVKQAYLFTQDNENYYFDEKGESLRRAFLKAPIKFGRISSTFSNSRLHPVLKIRRPHHGVDYAAPTGTPIQTIGDGKVTFIGRKGGYGNRIEIKHNDTYSTGYAHLSRFTSGLRIGDRVKQGSVIGYVGSTGLATGPHLDFRVYQNGKAIDPLTMKSTPAIPISGENKAIFQKKITYFNKLLK